MAQDYKNRYNELKLFVLVIFLIIIARLINVQLVEDRYKRDASNNAIRHTVQYPQRGEVYDRNGQFLAQSKEAYDLMVIPRDVKPFDTTLFCSLLNVEKDKVIEALNKAKAYARRKPSIMFKQLPKEIKMRFEEFTFPGFYTQYRTIRSYPFGTAGNILGYVGEVNKIDIQNDSYYRSGDYIGMSGIEKAYENVLRGNKGVKMELVDVHGMPKGSYANGMYDTIPTPGKSVISTIDLDLQLLGEELMQGKIGSIVAIEPSTGEILMMVSAPTYDPNLLIGRERSNNYADLLLDPRKPLFNRAVMSSYPPGSTFKLATGLVGLEEKVLTPSTIYSCYNGYKIGRGVGCHSHASPLDFYYSIQTSCNAYYCYVYRSIVDNPKYESVKKGFDVWRKHILSMGFGRKLNSDFIGELNGNIPTSEYYNKKYKNSWNSLTTISLSIGQGEIGVTPLQLANFISLIANRGHYYIPHIVKNIGDNEKIKDIYYEKHYSDIDPKYFEDVAEGMWRAVNVGGTAVNARIDGMDVCGKTGTAQNSSNKKDHSTFACFAPKDNPRISVSVYVEHGGFGATIALPIAKLVLERYLLGEIKSTELYEYVKSYNVSYPQYENKK